ncbi:MAG: bifunctional (p)ppGpp synthetase/guanosine-3',5'-bis(diphosphate) 3'-pyrophosphohydrolase [Hyphomicrobiaceae bacterium]|nr:bifunctional (p)ppGpp synthetase/guanosine-3',5'-bis(diphosphate) 3'-pyrophosphohydrolase [Hyphomicrobiaceae bacterium]
MMRQYELVERVRKYDPTADENLLNRAYVYAMMAHGAQKRASGDPFFSHPLEVAAILTELKLDDATIVAALLHDVIEDTDVTRAEIDSKFGAEIGALVDGLTKIKKLDLVSKKAEQAENFRKLLVAISSDIRVLLIKLADRLHNMRTLEHMKPQSRLRVSEETLEIYAPLAGRMGMQTMREELEELAFRWNQPEAYETVRSKLEEIRRRNAGLVEEIEAALQRKLVEAGLPATVSGREKKPFSIWRKMQNRQISLEQLSDIYAFRIVTDTVSDCYRALGIAHSAWRAVPGRFKDYISTPKQNNYQSIHTTIVGPRHQWVELQIRTKEMHEIAEYGVAAHTLYKDGVMLNGANTSAHAKENPYTWLRHLVDTLLEGDNSVEFLEHTKLELFQDQVFCFTPKGRLIALPRGATPIDFAYAVHTDVGNACVGAVVNGRQMPLTTQLRNGDQVEIVQSKGQTPPAAWERIAVTGKARSSIRRAARDALRKQYSELGRRLLVAAFRRIGQDYGDDKLRKSLPRLSQKSVEEVHSAVGRGELPVRDVIKAIVPDSELTQESIAKRKRRTDRGQNEEGWFAIAKGMGLKFRMPASPSDGAKNGPALPIRGIRNDVPVKFEEGGAVPGDRIVGVLSEGEGIRIFQIHSPKLKDYEHERWVDVTWDIDPEHPERFPAKIAVTALNEPGTLAQIAQVIGEADGNIDNVRMVRRAKDFTEMTIDLEVWDLDHLTQIISGLKGKGAVSSVERVFG